MDDRYRFDLIFLRRGGEEEEEEGEGEGEQQEQEEGQEKVKRRSSGGVEVDIRKCCCMF